MKIGYGSISLREKFHILFRAQPRISLILSLHLLIPLLLGKTYNITGIADVFVI